MGMGRSGRVGIRVPFCGPGTDAKRGFPDSTMVTAVPELVYDETAAVEWHFSQPGPRGTGRGPWAANDVTTFGVHGASSGVRL
jgi:hypothetical protein